MTAQGPLLALLHLTDSLFPIGSFAHSDGLEAATAGGAIATPADLAGWLDACLDDTIGRLEGPAVGRAWLACGRPAPDVLVELDEELSALRPSGAVRRASRAMGLRLLTTWAALHPGRLEAIVALVDNGQLGPALPVAFAAAAASSGVDRRSTIEAYAYSRLAAMVSAAMRLMPLGQLGAHALLVQVLARVPALANRLLDAELDRDATLESFVPAMDLAAMRQPYLHSRLFLS